MIKVIFVENNEIKMSKEEFEKLLEETYKRGKDENYEVAYNKGYKDGYCNSRWYNLSSINTDGSTITYLNTAEEIATHPNPWHDNSTCCSIEGSCKGE